MAKISVRIRNENRIKLVEKFRVVRDQLREDISNINLSDEKREEAKRKMQSLPRDSSPARRRQRCKLCSRPRANNRLTGLCRLHMRIAVIAGLVPGMHKASW